MYIYYITFSASQSTCPSFTFPFNCFAAFFHSGANFLQCPHLQRKILNIRYFHIIKSTHIRCEDFIQTDHGAKNSTSQRSLLLTTSLSKLLDVNSIDWLGPSSLSFLFPPPFPFNLSFKRTLTCSFALKIHHPQN